MTSPIRSKGVARIKYLHSGAHGTEASQFCEQHVLK
jgi:hypothetical protein